MAKLNTRYLGFRKLTSDLHFHTAAVEQTTILAFQDAELIGSGPIEEIRKDDDDIIVIKGEYFLKRNCTFVYAK